MAQANIKAVITAEDRASGTLKGFGNAVEGMGSQLLNVAKKASVALGAAATAATGFAVKSAADFEQTRIGLENMLGSADKARVLLKDISKFAAETPFEFPELAQAAKQLVAFGFNAEDAFKTMKQLGNVSAAVGAPINDLAYLMGTLRAQGRAFTIDIRQFAQRGIPIYEELGKVLKVNGEQLQEMIENGKVGFPEVQKAFENLAGEGGKWGKTMERQSKSVNGLFSTLKDTLGQTARELVGITQEGDIKEGSVFANLRDAVDGLNKNLPALIEKLKDLVRNILPQLKQWADNIMQVAEAIGNYLGPKMEALWNTITTKLLPALTQLWKEVLAPLIPVIGTVLVVALGLAFDAFNVLLTAISPVIDFLASHEYVFWAIVTVLGAMKTALLLEGALSAFKTVMVGVTSTWTSFTTLVTSPIIVPALVITAAIASINSIKDAWDAVNNAKRAAQDLSTSNNIVRANLEKLAREGTPDQRARAQKQLNAGVGLAAGTDNWQGGPTWVGEKGPEIVNLPRGSQVIPNHELGGSGGTVNITIQAGAFMGSQIDARKYATMIMDAYKDAMAMRGTNGVLA